MAIWLSSSLRNENAKLKIFVVRTTLLAKSHRCWAVGTCEPTRCLEPLWQRQREQDWLKIKKDFKKGADHLLFVSSWRYPTRRKLVSQDETTFPFCFFFLFRWLENQSSELQIRKRNPPIDDPHTHRWVHVTTKRQSATDWLLGELFPEGSEQKTGVRVEYGVRLTVREIEKQGVLCVSLKTEWVVSGC